MFKIVGMARKQGVYEGYAYDNTLLYVETEKKDVEGVATDVIKCKTENIRDAIKIGDTVGVHYDRYGKPSCVYKC